MNHPEDHVLDEIDRLVDEQLRDGQPIVQNVRCEICGGQFHGLPGDGGGQTHQTGIPGAEAYPQVGNGGMVGCPGVYASDEEIEAFRAKLGGQKSIIGSCWLPIVPIEQQFPRDITPIGPTVAAILAAIGPMFDNLIEAFTGMFGLPLINFTDLANMMQTVIDAMPADELAALEAEARAMLAGQPGQEAAAMRTLLFGDDQLAIEA